MKSFPQFHKAIERLQYNHRAASRQHSRRTSNQMPASTQAPNSTITKIPGKMTGFPRKVRLKGVLIYFENLKAIDTISDGDIKAIRINDGPSLPLAATSIAIFVGRFPILCVDKHARFEPTFHHPDTVKLGQFACPCRPF